MQEEPVFVAHANTGSPPEQGLSGARATGETVKGHRLDPQQFVDVRFRPDLGHTLRHAGRPDDCARSGR